MKVELLDDCRFPLSESFERFDLPAAATVDDWFWLWARSERIRAGRDRAGLLLIHANGVFTESGRRQELEGVELLKHVRLTPWLGRVRTWHAVVYSFEPLEHILRRGPGNVVLLSEGVTFLELPEAVALKEALCKAVPGMAVNWRGLPTEDILLDLARRFPAVPTSRDFRPFVASDYHPPDSAHDISNRWGIYELYRAAAEIHGVAPASGNFPEVDQLGLLPNPVQEFVGSLLGKKARYLDGESLTPSLATEADRARLPEWVNSLLPCASTGKKIAYIDDEASNGWGDLLSSLLIDTTPAVTAAGRLVMSEPRLLPTYAKAFDGSPEVHRDAVDRLFCTKLADWVTTERPDLLILDLRLLGAREKDRKKMHLVSGLSTARAVRRALPYLPILLFTASNKAETLAISRSFTIDDVWMKPGLGEHRPSGGGITALRQLGMKVQRLLSDEYSWLKRAGDEVESIRLRPRLSHWWEQQFEWPAPEQRGAQCNTGPIDSYTPSGRIRAKVLDQLKAILDLARAALRMKDDSPEASGSMDVDSSARPLRAAAFNRIGQIVELVHERDSVRDGTFGTGSINGRVGAFGPWTRTKAPDYLVFRRCDWVAFRLMALRNLASHPAGRDEEMRRLSDTALRVAACDVLAWLTSSRGVLAPVAVQGADELARTQNGLSAGDIVPVLRLHPDDQVGPDPTNPYGHATKRLAWRDGFRRQLAKREACRPILEKSDQLAGVLGAGGGGAVNEKP